ncbi:HD domain-containing protein [Urinicoccus massiliensis]|uniref:HD domain-containing protein n=1 Tax=Urinicoccus massiliensis TaxID=1723382 RepID=UPI000930D4A2|nr:HD domain-containing protein [Urinicoccus massiliensis]
MPTRQDAEKLLYEYTESEALRQHGHQVEVVMEYFAKINDEDVDRWGTVGLLHDLDYEKYPDQHCIKVREILEAHDYPEEIIRAIQSHGYGMCCDVKPESKMEKILYTIDELTGIINAACLLRPSRSVLDLKLKSLKKKYKDKKFAAGCDRAIIENGIEHLDYSADEVMELTIKALQDQAEKAGLKGNID